MWSARRNYREADASADEAAGPAIDGLMDAAGAVGTEILLTAPLSVLGDAADGLGEQLGQHDAPGVSSSLAADGPPSTSDDGRSGDQLPAPPAGDLPVGPGAHLPVLTEEASPAGAPPQLPGSLEGFDRAPSASNPPGRPTLETDQDALAEDQRKAEKEATRANDKAAKEAAKAEDKARKEAAKAAEERTRAAAERARAEEAAAKARDEAEARVKAEAAAEAKAAAAKAAEAAANKAAAEKAKTEQSLPVRKR